MLIIIVQSRHEPELFKQIIMCGHSFKVRSHYLLFLSYHSQDLEIEECSPTTSLPLPGHFFPLSPQKSQPNLSVHHQTIPILLMAALNQLISHSLSFIDWKC